MWCIIMAVAAMAAQIPDEPFWQEQHKPYTLASEEANDVRSIAVDSAGNLWAATQAGMFVLENGAWRRPLLDDAGPAYKIVAGPGGEVWAGAWDGLYRGTAKGLTRVEGVEGPVTAIAVIEGGALAMGPKGAWRVAGGVAAAESIPGSVNRRDVIVDGDGTLWVATGTGLACVRPNERGVYQKENEILSPDVAALAFDSEGTLWAGGLGGVTLYRGGVRVGQMTPDEGLHDVFVQCVRRGPDGRMWVGTKLGVARYGGRDWSLRHSRRWLLSDDVRDVAFGPDGTAYVATAAGVSAIRRRQTTLAEKAAYFETVTAERHVREPGLVEKVRLERPGDIESWKPMDDDNDGQYTAMYLAAECYRYAATKDPDARQRAVSAYTALLDLQRYTGTTGFVARTVVPDSWTSVHDANRAYSDRERADMAAEDVRNKPVEQRWRPATREGWLWKGDTSSDEMTGHFYALPIFYDLVADDAQKEELRGHMRRIMDHIIDHGYVLIDIDGAHTRWGVWAPERLNHDPDWATERGINSVEILSYLKATWHVTGDDKYAREYRRLLFDEGYAENVRRAKTYIPGWRTHIDDELLALAYPALLAYETDPELRALYRESVEGWYLGAGKENSPYFNFTYAMLTGGNPNLEDSLAFLRDTPLDLIDWTVDNLTREDLKLVRQPILDDVQTNRLLPPSERGVVRWDNNPWRATQGDNGQTEWAPTFWLLPYWMGRYNGFIN
ncbi:MAG TPA: two-component regulator propeller domain-containing protein [Candidatus Bathyarchaeia archaeon]|nr:two-component regulator propeller domain-containing protein [Candidatus Bathyarchaeia archaeon]